MLTWLVCAIAVGALTYILVVLFWGRSTEQGTSIDNFILPDSEERATGCGEVAWTGTTDPGKQVLVLYGSEYGFGEEVAGSLQALLAGEGYQARVLNARDHGRVQWDWEQVVLCVFSTSGDGVPPTEAWPFMDFISQQTSGFLSHLHYSVLALGDSNYPHFCRCGRTLDASLEELGGQCLAQRCDIDQEDWALIKEWMGAVLSALKQVELDCRHDYLSLDITDDTGFSRTRPYMGTLTEKHQLTWRECGEDKETMHAEFSTAGSGLVYQPGDALGLYPVNNPPEVESLLHAMHCEGGEVVEPARASYYHAVACSTLRDVLLYCCNLRLVRTELVAAVVSSVSNCEQKMRGEALLVQGLSRDNKLLMEYISTHEVLDILTDFSSHSLPYATLLTHLKPLQPRYYSIASSPAQNGDSVSVCVAVLRYSLAGLPRTGVASTFLQDRLSVGDICPVFISYNPDFRLPAPELPIIMIGPGTGIAPFRAFLQDRVSSAAPGINRLYCGCRHKDKDFLYREELESWQQEGVLQLRVACSRDQPNKVYVQHLMQKDQYILWTMLQDGAHVYVCGDARAMAGDVHLALLEVVRAGLGADSTPEQARQYLEQLEKQHRYQKDVWIT